VKLLVLGGTEFLGRYLVESALVAGHEVTLFNRGRRNSSLFPDVERIIGDRRGDLAALAGRRWDAAVDSSGYLPGQVRRMAERLRDSVDHYTFISTISVYAEFFLDGTDEAAPVAQVSEPEIFTAESFDPPERSLPGGGYGQSYGGLKALCEREAELAMPERTLVVRPGLIIGPHDYSGRYSYWVDRLARGGQVLAPGAPENPVRVIDVRDLADWIMQIVRSRGTGVFNATGRDGMTMREVIEQTALATDSRSTITWVPEEVLMATGMDPFESFPLWVPKKHNAVFGVQNNRAIATGLTFRPLMQTAEAVSEWQRLDRSAVISPGLDALHEAEILNGFAVNL
jgi:2'-hydroxyisoflavone reductase